MDGYKEASLDNPVIPLLNKKYESDFDQYGKILLSRAIYEPSFSSRKFIAHLGVLRIHEMAVLLHALGWINFPALDVEYEKTRDMLRNILNSLESNLYKVLTFDIRQTTFEYKLVTEKVFQNIRSGRYSEFFELIYNYPMPQLEESSQQEGFYILNEELLNVTKDLHANLLEALERIFGSTDKVFSNETIYASPLPILRDDFIHLFKPLNSILIGRKGIQSVHILAAIAQLSPLEIIIFFQALGWIYVEGLERDEILFQEYLSRVIESLPNKIHTALEVAVGLRGNRKNQSLNIIQAVANPNIYEQYFEQMYGYTLRNSPSVGLIQDGLYNRLQNIIIEGDINESVLELLNDTEKSILEHLIYTYNTRLSNIFPTYTYLCKYLDIPRGKLIKSIRIILDLIESGDNIIISDISEKSKQLSSNRFAFKPSPELSELYNFIISKDSPPSIFDAAKEFKMDMHLLKRYINYLRMEIDAFLDGDIAGTTVEASHRVATYRDNKLLRSLKLYKRHFDIFSTFIIHPKYNKYIQYFNRYLFGETDLYILTRFATEYDIALSDLDKELDMLFTLMNKHLSGEVIYFEHDGKPANSQSRNRTLLYNLFISEHFQNDFEAFSKFLQIEATAQKEKLKIYLTLDSRTNTFEKFQDAAFANVIYRRMNQIQLYLESIGWIVPSDKEDEDNSDYEM